MRRAFWPALLPLLIGWAACTSTPHSPTATLHPYLLPSPTGTAARFSATVNPIPTIGPTATPLTHIVQERETLLYIAGLYGITLDDLLAANPGLNPRLLSIGQPILIPGPGGEPIVELIAPATPEPLELTSPDCYYDRTGDLTCLMQVANRQADPMEGILVTVTLIDREGRPLASLSAPSAFGVLIAGGQVPLSVRFPADEAQGFFQVSGLLAGAYRSPDAETRLLAAAMQETRHIPSQDRLSWSLAGTISLPAADPDQVLRVTLLASGLDSRGRLVGFSAAQWESAHGGDTLAYDLTVFSLGPALQEVRLEHQAEIISTGSGG